MSKVLICNFLFGYFRSKFKMNYEGFILAGENLEDLNVLKNNFLNCVIEIFVIFICF